MNPPYAFFKENGKQKMLPMIQRSVLMNCDGRIDHMAVDPLTNRLYVAARGNNTLETLEVTGSKQLTPIHDVLEPTGLLFIRESRTLVLSCSGDNSVRTYSVSEKGDLTPGKKVQFAGEVDRIEHDAAGKRIYVAHGKRLGSVSLETGQKGESLELPGMPEGFVISTVPGDDRIYVNIQSLGTVMALKRDVATGTLTVDATWTLEGVKGNYAAAFDPATGHFFAISRNPGKFVVLDTKSGKQVASLDCVDDADDAFWDPVLKRVFVSGGGNGGRVDIFQQAAPAGEGKPATYSLLHGEPTNVGARTSVLVPEQRRLIVAAPKVGVDPTFLYIYLIGP